MFINCNMSFRKEQAIFLFLNVNTKSNVQTKPAIQKYKKSNRPNSIKTVNLKNYPEIK